MESMRRTTVLLDELTKDMAAYPAGLVHATERDLLARSGLVPNGDVLLIAEADEEDGADGVGMSWLVGERPDLRCDYALTEANYRLELADGRKLFVCDDVHGQARQDTRGRRRRRNDRAVGASRARGNDRVRADANRYYRLRDVDVLRGGG